jgi:hypothetical protein
MNKILYNKKITWQKYFSIILIFGLLTLSGPQSYVLAQDTTDDEVETTETLPEDSSDEDSLEIAPAVESNEETEEALIETGNADAIDETYNISNTNDIDTKSTSTDNASSSDDVGEDDNPPLEVNALNTVSDTPSTTPEHATIIEIENQSTSTTMASTSATTGNNSASTSSTSPTSTAIVASGDAYAYANIVNLTNTNVINSDGFILFLNQLFGRDDIDFRDLFDVFSNTSTSTVNCPTENCQQSDLETYLSNQVAIENNISVEANTGNNSASGGVVAVFSGDAYATANVTNVANTNIIDANYLVLTFSNFGDLIGDIIFPGKQLLNRLFTGNSSNNAVASSTIENQANVENKINVSANTGDNDSIGSSSVIQTGDAVSYSSVYNQINTNVIDGDSFTILFRVHGDWAGEIFGLPEGLSFENTDIGLIISNTTSQSTPATNNLSTNINNDSTIFNNISVSANTGSNSVSGNDLGYVYTGDAYAAANVTNIANTNILGRNWSLLIFDIFGDWQGNISFGQPDIWIGGTANAINGTTAAGSEILYTFTISNLGDAQANDIKLNGELTSDLMSLEEPIDDIEIGSIAPGETVEKTFKAQVTDELPSGSFPIDLVAEIISNEPDSNLDNNREVITVIAENISQRGGGGRSSSLQNNDPADYTAEGNIIITKSSNQGQILPGERVEYKISLTNSGGPIYDAVLYDTLYDSNGTVMLDQNWPLYTIAAEETITVSYDIDYATNTTPGTYFNRAQILGYHKNTNPNYAEAYDSMIATVPITVIPTSQILGLSTTTTPECNPYLSNYLKSNSVNSESDVVKLQTFLSENNMYNSPVTGFFGPATETAVKDFQLKHRSEILDPWGLSEPTGQVYYTTKKTINEIYCDNTRIFPLTIAQKDEIQRYKKTPHSEPTPASNPPSNTSIKQMVATIPPKKKSEVDASLLNKKYPPIKISDASLVARHITSTAATVTTTPSTIILLSNWVQKTGQNFVNFKFW